MIKELFPAWSPLQVAKHYGFPIDKYSGKGQTIAVISLGGPVDMDELRSDFIALKVPMPKVTLQRVMPPSISKSQDNMSSGETHLDVEVIGSICPDAGITIYRGANPNGFAAALQKAVDDRQSIIAISWGSSEKSLSDCEDMEAALKKAKEYGLTVCASSGDWGSSNARNIKGVAGAAPDGKAHLEYPSSSPYVLSCGGTELVSENGRQTEVAWNNRQRGSGACGGGVSELFRLPEWQERAGIKILSANSGKPGRIIPDVAGLAAGGDWMIYGKAQSAVTGGSSAVAPLWAAFIALVNEARNEAGKSRLGFVNEHLYSIAARGGSFNDVVSGTNRPAPDYPGYDAGPGFDACTGWGTPIGAKLFEALADLD